jgi:hypothetical protein
MKDIRQHVAQRKIVWVNKIVVTTIKFVVSETSETLVTSTFLLVNCPELKTDQKQEKEW